MYLYKKLFMLTTQIYEREYRDATASPRWDGAFLVECLANPLDVYGAGQCAMVQFVGTSGRWEASQVLQSWLAGPWQEALVIPLLYIRSREPECSQSVAVLILLRQGM